MVDFGERGEHMTTGGWIFMALGMLVLIVLVVALVLWLISQQRRQESVTPPSAPAVSAREALDHRLVDGAITTEQYDEIRAKLEGGAGRVDTS